MPKYSTMKERRLDGELGLIIDEMGRAMWAANKEYIATHESPLTLHMNDVLYKFQSYCRRYYGQKAKNA